MNPEPKNFVELNEEEILEVLRWRNHPFVRQFMNNDAAISEQEHHNFVNMLKKTRHFARYWKVDNIGVVYLNKIDRDNRTAYLGIYINPDNPATGKGARLMSILLKAAFYQLGLKTIFLEVFESNIAAIKLYSRFGFIPIDSPDMNRGRIIRGNKIIPMRLTLDDFEKSSTFQ